MYPTSCSISNWSKEGKGLIDWDNMQNKQKSREWEGKGESDRKGTVKGGKKKKYKKIGVKQEGGREGKR